MLSPEAAVMKHTSVVLFKALQLDALPPSCGGSNALLPAAGYISIVP